MQPVQGHTFVNRANGDHRTRLGDHDGGRPRACLLFQALEMARSRASARSNFFFTDFCIAVRLSSFVLPSLNQALEVAREVEGEVTGLRASKLRLEKELEAVEKELDERVSEFEKVGWGYGHTHVRVHTRREQMFRDRVDTMVIR